MKYMAKGPGGAAYELTREELQTPSVVQQLRIDESWVVRVGDDWVPLATFLGLTSEQCERLFKVETGAKVDTVVTDDLFSPNARWTPGSVLCLVIRLIGFYFLTQVFQGVVSFLSSLTGTTGLSFRQWIGPLLSYGCYVGVGLYLLLGAPVIINWAFRRNKAAK